MPSYIAILRGINVSGKNKLPMADLRASLGKQGFKNVVTYIQSGNVAFEAKETAAEAAAKKLEQLIKKDFGYDVPVIVFGKAYLEKVLAENPFLKKDVDVSKLHVTFLAEEPLTENLKKLDGLNYPPDEFALGNKAIYLHCPEGYGRTKYNNTFLENKLKVTATTRNWKTSNVLLEMSS